MSIRYDGKVVSIVDGTTVVVNLGSDHGIKLGQTFLIFGLGPMITDPDTGESLGELELVRGRAEVKHIQPRMSTLTSVDTVRSPDIKEIRRSNNGYMFTSSRAMTESVKLGSVTIKPLESPKIGDYVLED